MGSNALTWISCILILVVFWFILIRPQKKKEKQINAMRQGVKAGDKILTIGGIKARVIKEKEESLIIEAGDRVRMEVMRWSVSQILEEGKGSVKKESNKQIEESEKKEAENNVAKAEEEVKADDAEIKTEAPAEEQAEETTKEE